MVDLVHINFSVLLVGCGHMGSALARSWIQNNFKNISILTPDAIPEDIQAHGLIHFISPEQIQEDFDVIVLAVKPQILDQVCQSLSSVTTKTTLILSIAAGKTLSTLESNFKNSQPIIRAMPNLPASIGEGMTVCVANTHCSEISINHAKALTESIGHVEWIKDETLMNAVTAVSGSGPAYLFLLVEAMTRAGIECGLSEKLSSKLAEQTVIGSTQLLQKNQNILSATDLRKSVASKGGTTESAVHSLTDKDAIFELFSKAIHCAQKRGKELES